MKFYTPGIEAAPLIRAAAIMFLHTGIRIAFNWRGSAMSDETEHAFYTLQDKVLDNLSRYDGGTLPNFFYVVRGQHPPSIITSRQDVLRLPGTDVHTYRINVLDTLRSGIFTFDM